MKCLWHKCNKEASIEQKFCGVSCKRNYYTSENRKNMKLRSLEYKGSKCQLCGYSKCIRALEFHHINPSDKSFGIARKGNTRSWSRIKEELDKCILLCSNCHAEVEAGIVSIPH